MVRKGQIEGIGKAKIDGQVRFEVCVQIDEARIPVREEVKGASEILGLDQLYVTNEGKLIAVVASEIADTVVAGLRKYPNGRDACVIGEV
jgi:hydrogenase expression/formation protein HypE